MTVQNASSVRVSRPGIVVAQIVVAPTAVAQAVVAQALVVPKLIPAGTGKRARPEPADTTEGLLRRRDGLPASDPDRAVLRARAIEENLPMARRLARRYAGRGEPLDDLAQVAAIALIKAVDGYDSTRPNLFISYAIPSIIGALKRHFRDTTWGMRVPRAMQELVLMVWSSSGELAQRLGRAATTTELAAYLNVTLDRLLEAQAATLAYRPASLDESLLQADASGGVGLPRALGQADPQYGLVEDHLMLSALVAALPERDRRIVRMRFDDEMTQSQIAAEIGVSQMHVSRLLRRSLTGLQRAMNGSHSRLAAPRD